MNLDWGFRGFLTQEEAKGYAVKNGRPDANIVPVVQSGSDGVTLWIALSMRKSSDE